jgi:Flp pilus assembly protein TadD
VTPPRDDTVPPSVRRVCEAQLRAIERIGYDYYQSDRFDRARTVFEGLHALAARRVYPLRGLAETCLALGDGPAALRAANGVVALASDDGGAYCLRGRVLLAANRSGDAKNDLIRAARLGDDLAEALLLTLPR